MAHEVDQLLYHSLYQSYISIYYIHINKIIAYLRIAREDVAHEVDQLLEARRLPRRLEQKQLSTQSKRHREEGGDREGVSIQAYID